MTFFFTERSFDDIDEAFVKSHSLCLFFSQGEHRGFLKEDIDKIVDNSFILTEQTIVRINRDGIRALGILFQEKYGIMGHSITHTFSLEIDHLLDFSKRKNLSDIRVKKGLAPTLLSEPDIYRQISNLSNTQSKIEFLLEHCEFVTMWPRFGDTYGIHCQVFSKKLKFVTTKIVPALLGLKEGSIKII